MSSGLSPSLVPELLPSPFPARRERWWLHILLFVLTFAMASWAGAMFAQNLYPSLAGGGVVDNSVRLQLLRTGILTFTLPLLAILFCHEMGHYLLCRRYGIDASPPYFIPFPPIFFPAPGTFGAFIRIREPFRNRKQLFDIGVGGPLAGFLVTIPTLVYGILHTRPHIDPYVAPDSPLFGYPLAIRLLQTLLHRPFTSLDVYEHPSLMAGWFGLLVTALNLLPFGQLDGGHAMYAIFGRHQKKLVVPLLLLLAFLGFSYIGWWVWIVIILVLGTKHPPVLDDSDPLPANRKIVAFFVLLVFLLCFIPKPIWLYEGDSGPRRAPEKRRGTLVHELHFHAGAKHAG